MEDVKKLYDDSAELDGEYLTPVTDGSEGIFFDFTYIDINQAFFANLFLLIAFFLGVKYIFIKIISTQRKQSSLDKNQAFAFSYGCILVSLALIFTSSVYGQLPDSISDIVSELVKYCGLGILLIAISGLIFDKLFLTQINLAKEISNNNLAAAILEGGHFISSALIIMTILVWVEPIDLDNIKTVIIAYLVSQLILSLTGIVWRTLFVGKRSFYEEIKAGNVALAIDFFGKRIATALAINIATALLSYQSMFNTPTMVRDWFITCLVSIFLMQMFAFFASRVIIGGHKEASKKIADGDVPTSIILASIYISFGIILSGILS